MPDRHYHGDYIGGDYVRGDSVQQSGPNNVYNKYVAGPDPQLTERAAVEFRSLLAELETRGALEDRDERAVVATVTETSRRGRLRAIGALLRQGGAEALTTALDHPAAAFVITILEGMAGGGFFASTDR